MGSHPTGFIDGLMSHWRPELGWKLLLCTCGPCIQVYHEILKNEKCRVRA